MDAERIESGPQDVLVLVEGGGLESLLRFRADHNRGYMPAAMGRIRAPVGLNIAAVTAPEIALSILAEVVAARRGAALGARPAAAAAPGPAVAA